MNNDEGDFCNFELYQFVVRFLATIINHSLWILYPQNHVISLNLFL